MSVRDKAQELFNQFQEQLGISSNAPPTICFHPDTAISKADGSKKPIKDIRVGDLVTSYDDNGKLVPRPVTRTMDNTVKFILYVHGLLVTPGHVTLCGDGRFDGQHVPMIDILRSDGVLVKADGTKVAAGAGVLVS